MRKDIEFIADKTIKSFIQLKILQFKYCIESMKMVIGDMN